MKTTRQRTTRSHFDLYLSEIDGTALLTAAEERTLANQIASGDVTARDRLVRANLRLVVHTARSFTGRGVALEDLIAEGNMGLLRAVEGYDPNHGTRFATYASYWIKQSIRRAVGRDGNTVRLPQYVWTLLAKWHRMASTLHRELGQEPTEEEIARRLGLNRKQTRALQKARRIHGSGQTAVESDGASRMDRLADGGATCPGESLAEMEQLRKAIVSLGKLSEREATILRLRFGLDGEDPITLKEVGEQLGYTRERVRQIEREALARLREYLVA